MEIRVCKISVRGCSSSKNCKQYSMGLPTTWMRAMNITPDERDAEISFDGSSIIIRKADKGRKSKSKADEAVGVDVDADI